MVLNLRYPSKEFPEDFESIFSLYALFKWRKIRFGYFFKYNNREYHVDDRIKFVNPAHLFFLDTLWKDTEYPELNIDIKSIEEEIFYSIKNIKKSAQYNRWDASKNDQLLRERIRHILTGIEYEQNRKSSKISAQGQWRQILLNMARRNIEPNLRAKGKKGKLLYKYILKYPVKFSDSDLEYYDKLFDKVTYLCELGLFGKISCEKKELIFNKMLEILDLYAQAVIKDNFEAGKSKDFAEHEYHRFKKMISNFLKFYTENYNAFERYKIDELLNQFVDKISIPFIIWDPDFEVHTKVGTRIHETPVVALFYNALKRKKIPDSEYDNNEKVQLKRKRYTREDWIAEFINDINHIKSFEWQIRGDEFPYTYYSGDGIRQKIKRFRRANKNKKLT